MSDGPDKKDEQLNAFVERYMRERIQKGTESGMAPEAMEQSMEVASFILSIKMLRNYYGGNLPQGNAMKTTLAEVMQETPEQANDILIGFQKRGWLSNTFDITPAGQLLVGEAE